MVVACMVTALAVPITRHREAPHSLRHLLPTNNITTQNVGVKDSSDLGMTTTKNCRVNMIDYNLFLKIQGETKEGLSQ